MSRATRFLLLSVGLIAGVGTARVEAQDYVFGGQGGFGRKFSGIGEQRFLHILVDPVRDINGLGNDEQIATIALRPADGLIYGIALNPKLDILKVYELNPQSGLGTLRFGPFPVVSDPNTLGGGAINPTTDAFRVVLNNGYHGVFNFDGTWANLPTPFFPVGDPNVDRIPQLHNLAFLDSFFAFDSGTGSVVQGPTASGELTTLKKVTLSSNNRVIGFDTLSPTALTLLEKNPFGANMIEYNPATNTITRRTFNFLAMPRFPESLTSFSHLME